MAHTVTALNIYPVKSLAGIALTEAEVTERGLAWDRRWMIVDELNQFITQRTVPKLATIKTHVTDDGALTLFAGQTKIELPPGSPDGAKENVRVWDSVVPALRVSRETDAFLSSYLSLPCSLVFMADDTRRAIDPDYATGGEIVSFADGYPILLANTASLDDLNRRMERGVPMNRFRPNIVVETDEPFFEDDLGLFRLGNAVLEGVKPCARCPITTIDQETGEPTGKEPLRTLATFRRGKIKGVNFGENLVVRKQGQIRLGDQIERLAPRRIMPFTPS